MAQKKKSPKRKKVAKKYDKSSWLTTENALTAHLSEELLDAYEKVKDFSLSLGEQRVYASGKSVMFSKKACFFFVRPKKTFIELIAFLGNAELRP